jgi:6-O-methylguanine DNA methyltransferase, DNA binding domain
MNLQSVLENLKSSEPSSFHVLDPEKAARMNAKTLFIPSPENVANAIRAIPKGKTRTIVELRNDLAAFGSADTACPAKTIKYWKWLAIVSESEASAKANLSIPWWRVLKDGKPSRHMPGGVEEQVSRLNAEGVELK